MIVRGHSNYSKVGGMIKYDFEFDYPINFIMFCLRFDDKIEFDRTVTNSANPKYKANFVTIYDDDLYRLQFDVKNLIVDNPRYTVYFKALKPGVCNIWVDTSTFTFIEGIYDEDILFDLDPITIF